jgi:Secretion system C-terminal sorting domain
LPNNSRSLGCLFIFGSIKTQDFIAINSDTWIELNADGTLKYRGTVAPATSITAIDKGETVANESLVLSPNPPTDYLNVSYSVMGVEPVKICIFNMNGTLLYSKTENSINGFNDNLNVSDLNLTAGTYFLSVNSSRGIQTKRFIISK